MIDYKLEAAKAALTLISPNQTIGLGAGSTIAHLVNMLAQNPELAASLTFTSSSFKTTQLLSKHGLRIQSPALLHKLDIYFDGCDQFDSELNALKSGGGIHTTEKILASMAQEFILLGDEGKFSPQLNATYPLVIEILPQALQIVLAKLSALFPSATLTQRMSTQKDGALISDNGNMLVDLLFTELPEPVKLNTLVKMIPGVVEHSLFYQIATKAIIAGENGIRTILPQQKI
ncbi:ribose-5-phosphate isomerase [Mucilaginibacter gossypiicola]|uniref:Ribose 5-phosphate isomerase A n=1 Tax=Mucilaginibacter gossypiicola TaxID=551995 RepID=A0A1H8KJY3_9SPHI|nr:ribose 5-phosphate isomerase A [Mucilaginibacter gossypiicola]SEN93232.1 ribose-5-phosphate isomerase [Mucilaginibacter gossypiicola]